MAEIEDARLAEFQKLAALVAEMQADPESRAHMDKAIKKVRPHVETEADIAERYAAPVKEEVKSLKQELADMKKQRADELEAWKDSEEKRQMHSAFARLRKDNGYTDEGINEIADLMVKRGIADPEAAALVYDKLHPAPLELETSSYEPQGWKMGSDDDVKRLFTDPNGWEADAIKAAITDTRRQAAN